MTKPTPEWSVDTKTVQRTTSEERAIIANENGGVSVIGKIVTS